MSYYDELPGDKEAPAQPAPTQTNYVPMTDASTSGGNYSTTPAPLTPPPAPSRAPAPAVSPTGRSGYNEQGEFVPPPSTSASPPDIFSGLGDIVEQFRTAQGPLHKAGAVLDAQSAPWNQQRNRIGQKLVDYVTTGNEDATISGVGDTLAHPENIAYALGEKVLLTEEDKAWALEHKDELLARSEGDIGAGYDMLMEKRGATPDEGFGGMVKGMGFGMVADPLLAPSVVGNIGASAIGRGLARGGQMGLARGVTAAQDVANAAIDFTDPILRVAGNALPSPFGRSETTQAQIAGETITEAAGAYGAARNAARGPQPTPASIQPLPAPATPVATAPAGAPPSSPASPAAGTAFPSGQGLPPTAPSTAAPTGAAGAAPPGTNVVDSPAPAAPAPPIDPRVVAPGAAPNPGVRARGNLRTTSPPPGDSREILFDPSRGSFWSDGADITPDDLARHYDSLPNVDPDDFYGDGWWARMRGAMQNKGYLYNDWPKNKITLRNPEPEVRDAARRWHDLETQRVTTFGDREVQRLLDDYATDFAGRDTTPPGRRTIHFGHRSDAITEVLKAAGYTKPVIFQGNVLGGKTVPGKGKPLIGKAYGTWALPNLAFSARGAIQPDGRFGLVSEPQVMDIALADEMLVAERDRGTLMTMMHDPDAFMSRTEVEDHFASGRINEVRRDQLLEYNNVRKRMYQSGKWEKPNSTTPKDASARARAVGFRDYWQTQGGTAPSPVERSMGLADHYNLGPDPEWLENDSMSREMFDDYANSPELGAVLREQLDELGLHDVSLNLLDSDPTGGGRYRVGSSLIKVFRNALDVDPAEMSFFNMPEEHFRRIVDHEAVHAFRDLGLIRPDEWQILVREARELIHPDTIGNRHTPDGQTFLRNAGDVYAGEFDRLPNPGDAFEEEAVAELFAWWRAGKNMRPEARGIIERLFEALDALVRAIRGTPAEQVLRNMDAGVMGTRERGPRMISQSERDLGINPYPTRDFPLLLSSANTQTVTPPKRNTVAKALNRGYGATDTANMPIVVDDRYQGVPYAEGYERVMEIADSHHLNEWKGRTIGLRELVEDIQDDLVLGRSLARQRAAGTLDDAGNKELTRIIRTYGDDLSEPLEALTDVEEIRVLGNKVADVWQKPILGADTGNTPGIGAEVRQVAVDVANFRRGVGLANWAAFPRQVLTQSFGNVVALAVNSPRSLIGFFDPRTWGQTYRGMKSPTNTTDLQDELAEFGLGYNAMVFGRDKTIARHQTEVRGSLGRLANILAPSWARNLVATPDEVARQARFRAEFRPAIKRELNALPRRSKEVAAQFQRKHGGLLPVVARIEREMGDIIAAHKKRGQPYARLNATQLETEIIHRFQADVKRGTVDTSRLRNYANRVGRDWASVLNTENQRAAKKVREVFFSWDNTQIDDVVQNVFLYHYWATRATALYAREMVKKPWMAAGFIRMGQQLQEEAEQGDYPDWLKGWTRIMNSPAGVAMWMNPLDMIGTALIHAEWQYGANAMAGMQRDLTMLGAAREGMIPFVWNPLVEFGLYMAGAFGEGAQLPANPLGIDRMTSLGASVLNIAKLHGLLPAGMGEDALGNFQPFAPRPITDILGQLVTHFGKDVPNPYGGVQASQKGFLYDVILEDNPTITSDELLVRVQEIEDAVASGQAPEEWVESQRRLTQMQWTGPVFPGLPDALKPFEGFIGAGIRQIAPIRITAQSETKMLLQKPDMANVVPGMADNRIRNLPTDDQYDAKDVKNALYDTPEALALDNAYEQWYDGGNPELAALMGTYYDIANGAMESVSIGDVTFANDGTEEAKNYDLANEWLASQGFTEADINAFYDERDAMEAANPDLANYRAYQQHVGNYPGGAEAFVDEAVRTNESFADFMRGVPYAPGTPDYYDAATWPDAYFALTGQRGSVYDPLDATSGTVAGNVVPGLPSGTSFATKRAADEQIELAVSGEGDYAAFEASVSDDVKNLFYGQQVLDEIFGPGVYKVGDYLPGDHWDMALAGWKSKGVYVPKPEDAPVAYEYADWLANNATAPDHSVSAFLASRERGDGGGDLDALPEPTPEAYAEIMRGATLVTAPSTGKGAPPEGRPARTAQTIEIRSGPNPANPMITTLPPGLPIDIVASQDGWIQVIAIGGATGWMPESYAFAR
jgi:hypothetical protein